MPIKKLCIELTDYCNLNCEMCYRKTWTQAAGHMDSEVLDRLLHMVKTLPELREIVIGGIGEPTCHPRYFEVIEKLSDYSLTVTTNGTTLDEKMAAHMAEHVRKVVVSIDGAADQFKAIRGYDYHRLVQQLTRLQAHQKTGASRHELVVQMVISSKNIADVPEVIALCASLRVSELILSNLVPVTAEQTTQIMYTQGFHEAFLQKQHGWRNLAMRSGLTLKMTEGKLKTDRYCRFIEQQAGVVTAGGEMVPCYRLAHEGVEFVFGRPKQLKRCSFGSLATSGVEDIWNSGSYSRFRQMVLGNRYPSCPDCDLADGCDYVNSSDGDCYGNGPSCADCLWARNIVYCV